LDDLAQDRIICGIGAWWDPLAKNVGIDRKKPLTAMKETVLILRRLLNLERVTFDGEFIHVSGIELDVVHGRREPRHVPIMIGATGDQMMELAGEVADGVVLNYCAPPEHNDHAMELLEKGTQKSGRKLEDLERPQLIVCSVDHDHDKAIEASKMLLCQYLAQQPHIAKASGVSQELVAEIQSILGWPATKEQINKAKYLVPDELVLRITASGTPDEARTKVQEYIKRGATCPVLYSAGGNMKLLIDTFAPGT
jgi:5,10-methylenetetrahydromethanopterin reductase